MVNSSPKHKIDKTNLLFLFTVVILIIVIVISLVYHNKATHSDTINKSLKDRSPGITNKHLYTPQKQQAQATPLHSKNNESTLTTNKQSQNNPSINILHSPIEGVGTDGSLSHPSILLHQQSLQIDTQARSHNNNNLRDKSYQADLLTDNRDNLSQANGQLDLKSTGAIPLPSSIVINSSNNVQLQTNRKPDQEINQPNNLKRERKEKSVKNKHQQSWLSYGVTTGTSIGPSTHFFYGAEASLKIYGRLRFNPTLIFHQGRQISGNMIHPSYFRPDSIGPFSISDDRKINVASIPINFELNATNSLRIKGGILINILQKQYGVVTKINSLPDKKDTLNQSFFVNRSLQQTQFSNSKLGINMGIAYQYSNFNFSALYVRNLKSYQVISPLGSYSSRFHALQLSIGYQLQFNKKEKGIK